MVLSFAAYNLAVKTIVRTIGTIVALYYIMTRILKGGVPFQLQNDYFFLQKWSELDKIHC